MLCKQRGGSALIVLTIIVILILVLAAVGIERLALPIAMRIADEKAVTRVNTVLAEVIADLSQKNKITGESLYSAKYDKNGHLTSLTLDSPVVNRLCADTADRLSRELNGLSSQPVRVPLAALTGVYALPDKGPCINMYLSPVGSATADYETETESAGAGRFSFKVWLVVRTDIGIVSLPVNKRLCITRKIMLVNALFAGDVPYIYNGDI